MTAASDVARYLLSLQDEDTRDITNLKLQKLLYYSQGFHLAILGGILFPEPLEAWGHGPVVPSVWRAYRNFGSMPLPVTSQTDIPELATDSKDVIDEVYDVFGKFSAWTLRNMTHEEPPWQQHQMFRSSISISSLAAYFNTQIIKG